MTRKWIIFTSTLQISDMFFPTTTSKNMEVGETSGLQANSFGWRLFISSPAKRLGSSHLGEFGILVKFCNQ